MVDPPISVTTADHQANGLAPLLLSEREAARLLGISPRTLWQLRKDGEIPAVRINRCVRYDLTDLTRFIEKNK